MAHELFTACENGQVDIVALLLTRPDIDVNDDNRYDVNTPLYIACENGHDDVVKMLLQHLGTNS